MKSALAVVLLGPMGCGGVEKSNAPPCERYCDHMIVECGEEMERTDCDFICDCMGEVVRPEVAEQFVECLAGLQCGAVDGEEFCANTVGAEAELEASEAAVAYMTACDTRVDAMDGCAETLSMPCESASFFGDATVAALEACLPAAESPDCPSLDQCITTSFFIGCAPGGP